MSSTKPGALALPSKLAIADRVPELTESLVSLSRRALCLETPPAVQHNASS